MKRVDRVDYKSKEAGGSMGGVCPEFNYSIRARRLEQKAPCCLNEENFVSV